MKKTKNILLIVFGIITLFSCNNDDPEEISERSVLIYMAADNNLSYLAKTNVLQMQQNIANGREQGRLIVYIDPSDDVPNLIEITKNGKKIIKVYPEQNSASASIMRSVINDVSNLFPSNKYGLVLWSHATAWLPANSPYATINSGTPFSAVEENSQIRTPRTKAFAQDGDQWLELSDLNTAIPDHFFDYILFDACYMGSIEVIYELRNKATKIIASPAEVLSSGFPYNDITDLLTYPEPDLEQICRIYYDTYNAKQGVEQSATVALYKTSELQNLLKIFKEIVSDNPPFDIQQLCDIQIYDRLDHHLFFDFDDYISQIANQEQLTRFRNQLQQVVTFKLTTPQFYSTYDITKYSGLSIYIPQEELSDLNHYYYSALEWGKAISGE